MSKKHIDRVFQEKFKDFYVEPPSESWSQLENELNLNTSPDIHKKYFLRNIYFLVAACLFIFSGIYFLTEKSTRVDVIINSEVPEIKPKPKEVEKINYETNHLNSEKPIKKTNKTLHQKKVKNFKNTFTSSKFILLANNENSVSKDYNKLITDSLFEDDEVYTSFTYENTFAKYLALKSNFSDEIFEEISENNIVELNEVEKLQIEKEEEPKNSSEKVIEINRWLITPTIASVFFNTFRNGSPIDEKFIDSDKTFSRTLSVGVGVTYNINNKISVRSGIQRVNLAYSTNNVIFFANLNSNGYSTITYEKERDPIFFDNANNFLHPNDVSNVTTNSGSLEQSFSFLEIPMELNYYLINRKFGFKVIGGFSSLILLNNSIDIVSDNFRTQVGIANNVNPIHFSTNIGLGVDYQFLKSFRASIEPMFKYQLNTFNNNSGNFRPYFIGVYSGISYQF